MVRTRPGADTFPGALEQFCAALRPPISRLLPSSPPQVQSNLEVGCVREMIEHCEAHHLVLVELGQRGGKGPRVAADPQDVFEASEQLDRT